ncbi:Hsp33 family molecular chaperone HslO [Roseomonas sp. 18066]|uniref:Hsp33 family molecular chaperone HslO n=1 Tax=Roseomonas sp. 18066 TaxID=2681412 RepID=UPI001358D5AF|nr:Hsp33 family molecular chaperone HslO [Roseomonas sp. 18066]
MIDPTSPSATPDFLNHDRAPVPHLTVPRGVTPFHLENKPVRGRLVRLGPLAEALLTRHDYAPEVAGLLGQGLALTAGLAAALKFQGSFSLQAKGDGPVGMLLADCTDAGALRGYARAEPLPDSDTPPSAEALLGKGYMAFTCDQGPDMERYQGIVAIEGDSLAAMTGAYFESSEQLDARVWLYAAKTPGGWRASALILERVAGAGGIGLDLDAAAQQDAWETALVLASTVTEAEMLDDALAPDRLLFRLFHAEGLALDRPRPLSYGCRCSRAKLASVLNGFGAADLDHMAEDGVITMTCEFCNVGFRFQREDVATAAAGG